MRCLGLKAAEHHAPGNSLPPVRWGGDGSRPPGHHGPHLRYALHLIWPDSISNGCDLKPLSEDVRRCRPLKMLRFWVLSPFVHTGTTYICSLSRCLALRAKIVNATILAFRRRLWTFLNLNLLDLPLFEHHCFFHMRCPIGVLSSNLPIVFSTAIHIDLHNASVTHPVRVFASLERDFEEEEEDMLVAITEVPALWSDFHTVSPISIKHCRVQLLSFLVSDPLSYTPWI